MKTPWTTTGNDNQNTDNNYQVAGEAANQAVAIEDELAKRPAGAKRQIMAVGMAGVGITLMLFGITPYFSDDSNNFAASTLKTEAESAGDLENIFKQLDALDEEDDTDKKDNTETTTSATDNSDTFATIEGNTNNNDDNQFVDVDSDNFADTGPQASNNNFSDISIDDSADLGNSGQGGDALDRILSGLETTNTFDNTIQTLDTQADFTNVDDSQHAAAGSGSTILTQADFQNTNQFAANVNVANNNNAYLGLTPADTAPEIMIAGHRPNYHTGLYAETHDFNAGQARYNQQIGGQQYPAAGQQQFNNGQNNNQQVASVNGNTNGNGQQPVNPYTYYGVQQPQGVYLHGSAPYTAQSGPLLLPLLFGAMGVGGAMQVWRRRRKLTQ